MYLLRPMNYRERKMVQRALWSLPWYALLLPGLFLAFIGIFGIDQEPENSRTMLFLFQCGLFAWIIRQIVRLAIHQFWKHRY